MSKNHCIQPITVFVAPMVVIEFLRLPDAEIQQLHLYVTLYTPEILDKIVPSPEQASQFLTFDIRNDDTIQTAVLELPCYKLRIYPIRFGVLLLALSVDIGRVHDQRTPTIALETTVCTITAT